MFRTEISIPESPVKISHQTPIMTIGSCFSDCMGSRFVENKFDSLSNPFGTVYNPMSISKLLAYALNNEMPAENSYTESHDLWANFDFHSSFSHENKSTVKDRVQLAVETTKAHLAKTQWLIVTLGTAWVYQRINTSEVVANCHKLPPQHFKKKLLTEAQIVADIEPTLHQLLKHNKHLNVILTVSPVRHIKDTISDNMLSKSILRVVCERLTSQHDQIHYFPSYEIMMDDLRDYRFYKSDMLHPNDQAEQYIWNKFSDTYFDKDTKKLLLEWIKIMASVNHKPFNPDSKKHQNFLKQTIERLSQLQSKLDVKIELKRLKGQLTS